MMLHEELVRLGPIRNTRRLVRRNKPCLFCTSGRKFKRCHGAPTRGPIPTKTREKL